MESGVTKLFLFCFVICIIASEQSSIILSAHVPACIDSALWTMGVCSYWEHVNSQSTHWICLKKLPLVAALSSWYAENFTLFKDCSKNGCMYLHAVYGLQQEWFSQDPFACTQTEI
jgi:hypothetical protein